MQAKPYQRPLIGAHLMLIVDNKLLLQKRKDGALAGVYTPVSGHVDEKENVIEAIVREAKEEAGIVIYPKDLEVSVVAHLPDAPYKGGRADIINFFIFTDKFEGEISNREPDRCEDMRFYSLDNLPKNLMLNVFEAIKAHENGISYIVC